MGSYCTKTQINLEEKEILINYCNSCGMTFPIIELIKRNNFGGVDYVELCVECNERWEEICVNW